jgi:hypothetical protein
MATVHCCLMIMVSHDCSISTKFGSAYINYLNDINSFNKDVALADFVSSRLDSTTTNNNNATTNRCVRPQESDFLLSCKAFFGLFSAPITDAELFTAISDISMLKKDLVQTLFESALLESYQTNFLSVNITTDSFSQNGTGLLVS